MTHILQFNYPTFNCNLNTNLDEYRAKRITPILWTLYFSDFSDSHFLYSYASGLKRTPDNEEPIGLFSGSLFFYITVEMIIIMNY